MLLIGSRHRCPSCSKATRFARSARSQPIRRSTSTSRTPLLGFIDRPSADTTVLRPHPVQAVAWTSVRDCQVPNVLRSCRSSRLQRFPPQRSDPKIRSFDGPRVCCTPQPTMGFTTFRTPLDRPLDQTATRRSSDPKVRGESSPVADTLRSVPLLGSLTMPSPRYVLSDAVAFTDWRSLSPFEPCPQPCRHSARTLLVDLRALFHRGVRCDARDVAVARPLDAPLGFGSTRSDAAARFAPPGLSTGRFAWRPSRFGVPRPERREKAMEFRPCLAPCDRTAVFPEGSTATSRGGSGISRRRRLGRIPTWAPKDCGMPMDPTPRGGSTASVRAPEGARCRRHRDASPKRLVRDPALAPKSGDRWFELVLPILPRSPAYMMVRPLAADAHTRRCARLRATRAYPEGYCAEPSRRDPEGPRSLGEPGGATRRWAIADSWLRRLQQAGGPARARQSSCSPGRPQRDPKTASPLRFRRIGERAPKRRGCGWCRTSHLWW